MRSSFSSSALSWIAALFRFLATQLDMAQIDVYVSVWRVLVCLITAFVSRFVLMLSERTVHYVVTMSSTTVL